MPRTHSLSNRSLLTVVGVSLVFLLSPGCSSESALQPVPAPESKPTVLAEPGTVQELTQSNFSAAVLDSEYPVLVDFWAPWCGPCLRMAPAVEEIASKHSETVRVAKLNVDDERAISDSFNIRSLPTFIIFKDGQAVEKFVGAQPPEVLEDALLGYQ